MLAATARQSALAILSVAIEAVDPGKAVKRFLRLDGATLRVADLSYDLKRYRRVLVIGGGKAGAPMAAAIEEVFGDRVSAGAVNVKDGHRTPTRRVIVREAGHPIPDQRGLDGTREMLELVETSGPDDLVVAVISGGGSALIELPVEGVDLDALRRLTDELLRCGATINEMNAIRKHLSTVKGGGLARAAAPATVVSLILSDVVGNPLDVIASGPTVPDTSTFEDAWNVLERYKLVESVPRAVRDRLLAGCRGEVPETPKPGDELFQRVQNVVLASNELAAEAAVAKAEELGFHSLLLSTYVEGEAREVGKVLAGLAREIAARNRPIPRPACVVVGGETTVTIRGTGKGGRNQEMALSAAIKIAGMADAMVVAAATDGADGPTDAAGAIADGSTLQRAAEAGMDANDYLARNDSYHFFERLGDLIVTGPTNTNVNDLAFVYVF